ncbi:TIGR04104 family putative zinc finger protein [Pontibacillus marinus]|uniref:Cxxc_20_cxxc protein n=1 Tax=Pontibacillus marinus BH030004 = DSM 16465 TaxID=1385511 RepID=A0A0A5GEQ7_9BACI|nr:TIGR04104 family putative zinc finger protein [Pontibacillus marinus]KGX89703.1 hypothetical protein N783_04885 [Pontibacillus marinus BH030004 = DSM 16465]
MSIQKCLNCGKQFLWKEVQKAIFWGYKPIECQQCGTKHTVTMKTRTLIALFAGVTVLIVDFINISLYLDIILSVMGILSIGLLYPFFAKYKVRLKIK